MINIVGRRRPVRNARAIPHQARNPPPAARCPLPAARQESNPINISSNRREMMSLVVLIVVRRSTYNDLNTKKCFDCPPRPKVFDLLGTAVAL